MTLYRGVSSRFALSRIASGMFHSSACAREVQAHLLELTLFWSICTESLFDCIAIRVGDRIPLPPDSDL